MVTTHRKPFMALHELAAQELAKTGGSLSGVAHGRLRPLPLDWRGGYYENVNVASIGRQWKVSLTSKWSSDTIMFWLSSDEHSVNAARQIAATYLEVINQRRLG